MTRSSDNTYRKNKDKEENEREDDGDVEERKRSLLGKDIERLLRGRSLVL